jgi:hypothetical protein
MTEHLTSEELQTLINIVAQVQVPVAQAAVLIELINKMSRIITALSQEKAVPPGIVEPRQ